MLEKHLNFAVHGTKVDIVYLNTNIVMVNKLVRGLRLNDVPLKRTTRKRTRMHTNGNFKFKTITLIITNNNI